MFLRQLAGEPPGNANIAKVINNATKNIAGNPSGIQVDADAACEITAVRAAM